MVQGGISRRIVDFADALIGHFPSGLALVSILACMFFAAITGSAIAATAAIGGIMIPIMREKNYEDTFSAPLIACGDWTDHSSEYSTSAVRNDGRCERW